MVEPRSFCDFMSARFGGSTWVLARRTSERERRYGRDAVFLTQAKFRALERDHAEETAARIGPDLAAAVRAFLAVAPVHNGAGGPFRIAPDEGYWLALEKALQTIA